MIGYFAMPGPREWLIIIALLLVLLAGAAAGLFWHGLGGFQDGGEPRIQAIRLGFLVLGSLMLLS